MEALARIDPGAVYNSFVLELCVLVDNLLFNLELADNLKDWISQCHCSFCSPSSHNDAPFLADRVHVSMTLLFMPITLFALLLVTSVFCSIATGLIFSISSVSNIAQEPTVQTPRTPIAGFYSEWLALPLDDNTPSLFIQRPVLQQPLRVQLRWESKAMDAAPISSSDIRDMPPPPLPSRSESSTDSQPTIRSMKRFSINLPLQISDARDFSAGAIMASPGAVSPSISPSPPRSLSVDPPSFLTALAAQERRVLELKEELEKAESDLKKLKKQWAAHEATKKRNELRHMEPLRPLKSPHGILAFPPQQQHSEVGRMNREEERKRAIYIRTKQPQRKVFEGGRHTRALSLLSPTSLANRGSISAKEERKVQSATSSDVPLAPRTAVPRMQTTSIKRYSVPPKTNKDDLVSTGKQLVGDLREGLWTFIEDLRQATVGDEALTAARSKQIESAIAASQIRQGARSLEHRTVIRVAAVPQKKSPPTPHTANDIAPAARSPSVNSQHLSTLKPLPGLAGEEDVSMPGNDLSTAGSDNGTDDDGWSNWDSPPPKDASSNFSTTARSTPRSSLR